MTTAAADTPAPPAAPGYARHIVIVDPGLTSHDTVPVNVPYGPVYIDGVQVPGVVTALGALWEPRSAVVVTLGVEPDAVTITDRRITLGRDGVEANVLCPVDPVGDLVTHPFKEGAPLVVPVKVFFARVSTVLADTDIDAVFAT